MRFPDSTKVINLRDHPVCPLCGGEWLLHRTGEFEIRTAEQPNLAVIGCHRCCHVSYASYDPQVFISRGWHKPKDWHNYREPSDEPALVQIAKPEPWDNDNYNEDRVARAEVKLNVLTKEIILALGEGTAEEAIEKMLKDQREKFTG